MVEPREMMLFQLPGCPPVAAETVFDAVDAWEWYTGTDPDELPELLPCRPRRSPVVVVTKETS